MDYRTDLPHKETARVKYPDGVCGRSHCRPCRIKRLERGSEQSWGGLARMAATRRALGMPLDELDVMALEHVPDPKGVDGGRLRMAGRAVEDTGVVTGALVMAAAAWPTNGHLIEDVAKVGYHDHRRNTQAAPSDSPVDADSGNHP